METPGEGGGEKAGDKSLAHEQGPPTPPQQDDGPGHGNERRQCQAQGLPLGVEASPQERTVHLPWMDTEPGSF